MSIKKLSCVRSMNASLRKFASVRNDIADGEKTLCIVNPETCNGMRNDTNETLVFFACLLAGCKPDDAPTTLAGIRDLTRTIVTKTANGRKTAFNKTLATATKNAGGKLSKSGFRKLCSAHRADIANRVYAIVTKQQCSAEHTTAMLKIVPQLAD